MSREALLQAKREGKRVNAEGFFFGPYEVLEVGAKVAFLRNVRGYEETWHFNGWYIVEPPVTAKDLVEAIEKILINHPSLNEAHCLAYKWREQNK